jgi:hypothetical protein
MCTFTLSRTIWRPGARKIVVKADRAIAPVAEHGRRLAGPERAHAVDYAVVCPFATRPAQFDGILAEALALRDGEVAARPRRHQIPFASVQRADRRVSPPSTGFERAGLEASRSTTTISPLLIVRRIGGVFPFLPRSWLIVQCTAGFYIGGSS